MSIENVSVSQNILKYFHFFLRTFKLKHSKRDSQRSLVGASSFYFKSPFPPSLFILSLKISERQDSKKPRVGLIYWFIFIFALLPTTSVCRIQAIIKIKLFGHFTAFYRTFHT